MIVGAAVTASTVADAPKGKVPSLRFAEEHASSFLLSAILQAAAVVLVMWPLLYLYRAIRFRREGFPRFLRALVVGAPIAFAALFVARQAVLNAEAADIVPRLEGLAKEPAEDLINDELSKPGLGVLQGLAFASQLGVGAGIVMVSHYARRVGLLTNFMGILGIIVGVLFILPIFGFLPVVQLFWFGALAALFLGRWPGGRPPAWETGEEEPWPSAQEMREQRETAAMERDERRRGEPEPADEGEDEPDEEPAEPAAPAHPRSKKRKKKKKR